ncbi:unnamed protein product [Paramecium pentaurelia]|uniref:Transmembrane protein n=1 Tax=Paramecium pentaurelia TaxID=43138 RepID=A0A8S1TGI8_9CILI|nr:unnamed protein product [Paramecium pentaurelia]
MGEVGINIPLGQPLNKDKKMIEMQKELKDHINYVNDCFDKELLTIGSSKNQNGRRIKLSQYKVDPSIFGFSLNTFELRNHVNFLCQQFYQICISEPIYQNNKNFSQKEIDQSFIMKIIKPLTLQFGQREILIQILIVIACIGLIAWDAVQLQLNIYPEICGSSIHYLLYLRIGFLIFLFTSQLIYVNKAFKVQFYLSYFLSLIITILTILCLYGYKLLNEKYDKIIMEMSQCGLILIGCFLICIHLYKLEINLQRIRVLLGAQYQSPLCFF